MSCMAVERPTRGMFSPGSSALRSALVGFLASARALATTEEAIGKEAVQTIRAGGIVMASQLRAPILVRRGERVSVRARTGGVTVRTYAMAQQDGSLGELVMVTPTDSRDKYVARVSGVRELEVFAAGATAGDVAAFSR